MADRNGYIGRAPGDSSITIARKSYEPTGVQTDFTFSAGYVNGYCDVYLNGIKLINGNDYTATNGSTVGLTSAAQNGDIVEVVAYKAFNLGVPLSDITGDLDITGSVSASSSITADGGLYGDGSGLTGVASTDYIITGTAATFNSQVKVLNLNVTGITSTTSFNVGSATTIDGGGINVTGVITATTFSGNVSGGTVAGSTGTFSGAVNVDDTTDSTSVTTGALIVDGGVGIAKNVYIGAGLSVAGTLTYEDVTSVDSVGLITAKSGVNITGGQLQVGVAYSVGSAGVATALGFVAGTSGLSGTLQTAAQTNITSVGTLSGLTVSGGDLTVSGENILLGDSGSANDDRIIFGAGSDLQIYHSGTHSHIRNGTGELKIESKSDGQAAIKCIGDGAVKAYYGGSQKFETTNDGTVTTGIATATGGLAVNADDKTITVGASADLEIVHSGGHNFIKSGPNDFIIQNKSGNDNNQIRIRAQHDEESIVANGNGSVDIYYDNSKKFETTNDGANLIGITTFSSGGVDFNGILREKHSQVDAKLSAGVNINLELGMLHYYSVNETTTATPNIRYSASKSLNNSMTIGETVTVTIIYKPNGAGYYASLNVDGSGVTEEWNGGSAPSSANAGGYDILTHTLFKVADASFLCFSNVQNYA